MAQFEKEVVFGPPDQEKVDHSVISTVEESPEPITKKQVAMPSPSQILGWAAEHRKLAIVGAFGLGVFLGAVARR